MVSLPRSTRLYLLLISVILVASLSVYLFLFRGGFHRSQVGSKLVKNTNPQIEQRDYLLTPIDPKEEHKTTLYGEITRISGDILTVSNEKAVSVEISKEARFYRVVLNRGLESAARSDLLVGEVLLIGELGSSQMADYSGGIFVLGGTPTLVWHTD